MATMEMRTQCHDVARRWRKELKGIELVGHGGADCVGIERKQVFRRILTVSKEMDNRAKVNKEPKLSTDAVHSHGA